MYRLLHYIIMLQSIFGISQSLGLTEPTSQSIRLPHTTSQYIGLPKNISHSIALPKNIFIFPTLSSNLFFFSFGPISQSKFYYRFLFTGEPKVVLIEFRHDPLAL